MTETLLITCAALYAFWKSLNRYFQSRDLENQYAFTNRNAEISLEIQKVGVSMVRAEAEYLEASKEL